MKEFGFVDSIARKIGIGVGVTNQKKRSAPLSALNIATAGLQSGE